MPASFLPRRPTARLRCSSPPPEHLRSPASPLHSTPEGAPLTLVSDLSSHTRALSRRPARLASLGEPGDRAPAHPSPHHAGGRGRLRAPRQPRPRQPCARIGSPARPKSKLYVDFANFSFVEAPARLGRPQRRLRQGFSSSRRATFCPDAVPPGHPQADRAPPPHPRPAPLRCRQQAPARPGRALSSPTNLLVAPSSVVTWGIANTGSAAAFRHDPLEDEPRLPPGSIPRTAGNPRRRATQFTAGDTWSNSSGHRVDRVLPDPVEGVALEGHVPRPPEVETGDAVVHPFHPVRGAG